jgi:hypothetical protein
MKTIPQVETPANTLGNLRIPPTLNSLARLAEYQPKTHWQPGDPLPRHAQPDARAALARNADAYEQFKRDEERKHLADRRVAA